MWTSFFIIGEILTFISYLVFWISRFLKRKNSILLLDNVSRLFSIASFAFLGTFDGVKNTLYAVLRNVLGQVTNKRNKEYKIITFLLLLMLLILMYIFDFHGISTICLAICGILNLYGTIMCNEQGIRIFGMLGSIFYGLFMIFTNNIVGIICEIICFTVMFISYFKYMDKKKIKSKRN